MTAEDDGVRFDAASIAAERITEHADTMASEVRRLPGEHAYTVQIDFRLGDVITPAPVEAELPSLLDGPKAKLLTYRRETSWHGGNYRGLSRKSGANEN
jgi:hypothetical protein